MSDKEIKNVFEKTPAYLQACIVLKLLEGSGHEAFIVGGAVRDALLGLEIYDFDLATSARPEEMLEVFKSYRLLKHGIDFGTLGVVVEGVTFEITSYRGESDYKDQRHPDNVDFISSKDEDLKRRDFTINSMMFHPEKGLYDPFGGVQDLKNKSIKTVGDPVKRFEEDALRILRMLRFSINLGFEIEQTALQESKKILSSLEKLSKERVYSEIEKTLSKKIHKAQVELILKEYMGVKALSPVMREERLLIFEKASLLASLNSLIPNLEHYVLAKELKKYFSYFMGLSVMSVDEMKLFFVRVVEQQSLRGENLLRFWRVVEAHQKILKLNEPEALVYPSKDLKKRIGVLKETLSGKALGDAILEAKKEVLFI